MPRPDNYVHVFVHVKLENSLVIRLPDYVVWGGGVFE